MLAAVPVSQSCNSNVSRFTTADGSVRFAAIQIGAMRLDVTIEAVRCSAHCMSGVSCSAVTGLLAALSVKTSMVLLVGALPTREYQTEQLATAVLSGRNVDGSWGPMQVAPAVTVHFQLRTARRVQ